VRLTHGGEQLALHVLRRHRLVELFLVKIVGLDWSEVHAEAEELEHAISDKVMDRIDTLLGHPSVDPHGDPLPSAKGQGSDSPMTSLADCAIDQPLRVARVLDQDVAFLQFLDRIGLTPGTNLRVANRDLIAGAVVVQPDAGPAATLGTVAAAKVLVEPRKR